LATGSADIDARADLYALGCVMYWLLTGRLVFPAENAMAMVMAHVGEVPTPPTNHSELPIPPELRDVVMRCLEKNPRDRFSSATELKSALAGVPLEEPWTQDRARRWWHTHLPGAAEDTNEAELRRAHDISLSLETSAASTEAPSDGGRGRRRTLLAAAAMTLLLAAGIGVLGAATGWFSPTPVAADQMSEAPMAGDQVLQADPVSGQMVAPLTEPSRAPVAEPAAEPTVAPIERAVAEPARAGADSAAGPKAELPGSTAVKATVEPVAASAPAPEPAPGPQPERDPESPSMTESVPVAEAEPAAELVAAPRRFLADIELGAKLPPARKAQGGAERRPYTCAPYSGPFRFDCRGYYAATRGSWMAGSGTWLRRIATCEGRIVRSVELSKRWSPEATADQDDEIQASDNPQDDARSAAAAIAADFTRQGYVRARSESGNDGRRRGGSWEVVTFAVGATTATLRTQQEGSDYTLTVTANAPPSVCVD
jgi:hypothetical protein